MAQCKAKSKRTGERCRDHAMRGKRVCYHHGGRSLGGIASPTYKHGRFSKDLPTHLASRYHEAEADSELTSLRADICLVDAFIVDLLRRLDSGESGRLWRDLKRARQRYAAARWRGDVKRMARALDTMCELIDTGAHETQLIEDIGKQLDRGARLRESEVKRLVILRQMIPAEQAMLLVSQVVQTVRRHVHDRDTLAAIHHEFQQLWGTGDPD